MNEIYKIDDLKSLETFLRSQKEIGQLREMLFTEFLIYADYKNVTEWNKAVRICESLAIIGWGKYEALEAVRGMFFNGNPETTFRNKFGAPRFVGAIWSKRVTGFTMENGRTAYNASPDQIDEKQSLLREYQVKEDIQDLKIKSQRNWIPKNPILIGRGIANCYENSKAVLESIDKDLLSALNLKMQPEKYGTALNRIMIRHSHSYYDHDCCKCNIIIADEKLKLKRKDCESTLLTMFSEQEINKNGYYLQNRFEFGPFRLDTGKVNIVIRFEREFSQLSHSQQKEKFSEYLLMAVQTIVDKLKKKKLDYNFDLMLEDFVIIVNDWKVKK